MSSGERRCILDRLTEAERPRADRGGPAPAGDAAATVPQTHTGVQMKLRLFQVDAFASEVFEGNPAAVCPLDRWLDDALLQAIAAENNLSETAFVVAADDGYALRWFTPVAEVDLCGHATLAAAHVLWIHLGETHERLGFDTRSGRLEVERADGLLRMDFPATLPAPVEVPPALVDALGAEPIEVLAAFDVVAVYADEAQVRALAPDFARLSEVDARGVLVTAPGRHADFVSRCFFPRLGVNEDPVTGSAHCELAPYWASRLGRDRLDARQLSSRGGRVRCEVRGDRVVLAGTAVDYLVGEIRIPV